MDNHMEEMIAAAHGWNPDRPRLSEADCQDFLARLRVLNMRRCREAFKHEADPWNAAEWGCAIAGEAGELCNLLKKMRRGESVPLQDVADEIADVVIYLDLLAAELGVDLGAAIASKFNKVSERHKWAGPRLER